jgi:hypothetical protein
MSGLLTGNNMPVPKQLRPREIIMSVRLESIAELVKLLGFVHFKVVLDLTTRLHLSVMKLHISGQHK